MKRLAYRWSLGRAFVASPVLSVIGVFNDLVVLASCERARVFESCSGFEWRALPRELIGRNSFDLIHRGLSLIFQSQEAIN